MSAADDLVPVDLPQRLAVARSILACVLPGQDELLENLAVVLI